MGQADIFGNRNPFASLSQDEPVMRKKCTRKERVTYKVKDVPQHIHNTSVTDYIHVHYASYIHSSATELLDPIALALNHYKVMSVEYFAKYKMTRGDIYSKGFDDVTDWDFCRAQSE